MHKIKHFNLDKIELIMSKIKELHYKHYLILDLQLRNGLRISEVLNILDRNVFISDKDNYYYGEVVQKGRRSTRLFYVPKDRLKEIRQVFKTEKRNHFLFTNKKNEKYKIRNLNSFLKKIAKEFPEINPKLFRTHTFRHTFAVDRISKGFDSAIVSKYMGHHSYDTFYRSYSYALADQNLVYVKKFFSSSNSNIEYIE